MINKELIKKYNVAGPRYTSYPTVPSWKHEPLPIEEWHKSLVDSFIETNNSQGISLYIHLPFCEKLCTFCGCNKRITINHQVEEPYIKTLLTEWQNYLALFPEKPKISNIHLGGGTPTFFNAKNLYYLLNSIYQTATLLPEFELSFEAHPNVTNIEHLNILFELGSRRVSYGIQDFDITVQKAINRIQPFEIVKKVTEQARAIGYDSVNFDLIYGLPFQNIATINNTFELVNSLQPDRIAYYSYAHVPWVAKSQRGYNEADLPQDEAKRELYELGKNILYKIGYTEIGMDHFALPHDSLFQAVQKNTLHRNFMGYTHLTTSILLGLGVSAISECQGAFAQNEKGFEKYTELIESNESPVFRGHILDSNDKTIRQLILDLMCKFQTTIHKDLDVFWQEWEENLQPFVKDNIIKIQGKTITILPESRAFVRNVCMVFDQYLPKNNIQQRVFSSTV